MYFFPSSLPRPLQSGYSRKYAPNILRTQMSDGYVRQRLVNQGAPDAVSVTWMFTAEEFEEFLTWYKSNIHCGADWFVCPILSNTANSTTYQFCRIQNGQFTQALVFRNEETAMHKVTCTLDVSNTIVDNGSWEDYYSTGGTGEITGTVSPVEDAVSSGISEVIEEDTDTGAGIGTATTAESASDYDEV